jgi:hypothetical protein
MHTLATDQQTIFFSKSFEENYFIKTKIKKNPSCRVQIHEMFATGFGRFSFVVGRSHHYSCNIHIT